MQAHTLPPIIPKIIHQTWKDAGLNELQERSKASLIQNNTEYQYVFWGDDDIDNFIKDNYPELLFFYDTLIFKIQQVDLARLLIVYHYGGIYVDMDIICFKNFDNLLFDDVFFGEEKQNPGFAGYDKIISNAVFGATKGNRFIAYLIQSIITFNKKIEDPNTWVLKSTGPLLVTDCYLAYKPGYVKIYDSTCFFPLSLLEVEALDDRLNYRNDYSYCYHLFDGCWWKKAATKSKPWGDKSKYPLVSCVMPSRSKFKTVKIAIDCFVRQTYKNAELQISFAEITPEIIEYINSLNDDRIIVSKQKHTVLGDIRNEMNMLCNGNFIIQWDDDDFYHKDRIKIMLSSLFDKSNSVSLNNVISLIDYEGNIKIGKTLFRQFWEGSTIFRKEIVSNAKYSSKEKGEDTDFMNSIKNIKAIYLPYLYIYTYFGGNAWGYEHHVAQITNEYTGTKLLENYFNEDFDAIESECEALFKNETT